MSQPRLVTSRLSDVPPDPDGERVASAARRAALDVLPADWRVLPDGRAAHAVIGQLAAEHARSTGDESEGL